MEVGISGEWAREAGESLPAEERVVEGHPSPLTLTAGGVVHTVRAFVS